MSATMKGMIIRSTPDFYTIRTRLLSGNHHADHTVDLLKETRPSFRVSRCSRARLMITRCQDSQISPPGFSNPKPKRLEPPLLSRARVQAILTPVSGPTSSTTKKVHTLFKFG